MENPNEEFEKGLTQEDFYSLASTYLEKGHPEEAVKYYVQSGMSQNEALEKVGDDYFEGKNYMDAIDYYKKAGLEKKLVKAKEAFHKVNPDY